MCLLRQWRFILIEKAVHSIYFMGRICIGFCRLITDVSLFFADVLKHSESFA